MGGHTHDAIPRPVAVDNAGGKTLVTNAGSNSKFLGGLGLVFALPGAVRMALGRHGIREDLE